MAPRKRSAMAQKQRSVEQREPKTADKASVVFSFKYLVDNDDVGQSLKDWAAAGERLLLGLLQKMLHISTLTILEAQQDGTLKIYGDFPSVKNTDFKCPPQLAGEKSWGVILNIGGQKPRAAGFLRGNTFYVVYLDKDHRFWKSTKN